MLISEFSPECWRLVGQRDLDFTISCCTSMAFEAHLSVVSTLGYRLRDGEFAALNGQ